MKADHTLDITLPQLGETMEDAEIVAWHKREGDEVRRGEVLLEVQTDKIVAEVPALHGGVLARVVAREGQVVRVGDVLARLRVPQDLPASDPAPPPRVPASPSARRLARELGVRLEDVRGTGRGGRVTGEDVQRAASQVATPLPAVPERPVTLQEEPRIALSRAELAAARVTLSAKRDIPHFYVRVRADVTRLLAGLDAERARGRDFGLNDVLVRAAALALREHPRLNASFEEDRLRLHEHVHVGVMTATGAGLITSVVPRADELSPEAIRARVRDVRARAEAGRAREEDLTGATFCVSNLGMFGVEEFSAIILPPNVAILAVGAAQEEVVVNGGAMRVARTLRLTLSADHRALDGVAAALYLGTLRELLQAAPPFLWEGAPHGVLARH